MERDRRQGACVGKAVRGQPSMRCGGKQCGRQRGVFSAQPSPFPREQAARAHGNIGVRRSTVATGRTQMSVVQPWEGVDAGRCHSVDGPESSLLGEGRDADLVPGSVCGAFTVGSSRRQKAALWLPKRSVGSNS